MDRKMKVALIFGGKSVEHEVSLQSAENVFEAIDKTKYEVILIGIDKEGLWHFVTPSIFRGKEHWKDKDQVVFLPHPERGQLFNLSQGRLVGPVDVVFPLLHGPLGEAGTLQGRRNLLNVLFVGTGVLGSAIGMSKEATKRLLREAGIPVVRFLSLAPSFHISFQEVVEQIGLPFFVKPANLGSSVGISKVKKEDEFLPALENAFQYDQKVLLEEYIEGQEIECSILGNEDPIASVPGEIVPQHEFYSYEAKYLDEKGAILLIPARLPKKTAEAIREISLRSFKVLYCEGMARVDFLVRNRKEIFVSEVNTIPGFTRISMYPKLWEASGIPYPELIDRLIYLALERFEREKRLKTQYLPPDKG
ncbi:MAG: D-alanine--D-alanine ligase [Atribacterota bacterium]|nr:D-alanine--D-alanine ligase [Atribacterota bacterium]